MVTLPCTEPQTERGSQPGAGVPALGPGPHCPCPLRAAGPRQAAGARLADTRCLQGGYWTGRRMSPR